MQIIQNLSRHKSSTKMFCSASEKLRGSLSRIQPGLVFPDFLNLKICVTKKRIVNVVNVIIYTVVTINHNEQEKYKI